MTRQAALQQQQNLKNAYTDMGRGSMLC